MKLHEMRSDVDKRYKVSHLTTSYISCLPLIKTPR